MSCTNIYLCIADVFTIRHPPPYYSSFIIPENALILKRSLTGIDNIHSELADATQNQNLHKSKEETQAEKAGVEGEKSCPVCKKQVAFRNYPRHLRNHTRKDEHVCGICSKRYYFLKCFAKHKYTAHAETTESNQDRKDKHSCGSCTKSFDDILSLETHKQESHCPYNPTEL